MQDANFVNFSFKDSSWTIHENNIKTLLIEIYKSLNHINPSIMQRLLSSKGAPYSVRKNNLLKLSKTNTSRYRTHPLCFKENIVWNVVTNRYKNLTSLDEFKQQIKMWKATTCTSELCKAC